VTFYSSIVEKDPVWSVPIPKRDRLTGGTFLLLIEFTAQELFGNIQTEDFVRIGTPDTLHL
jgi:hypothetical protein